jgi:AP-2 complex subunit alpha
MTTTRKEFNELCTSPSGILLENSSVLIGVRQEYDGAQGEVTIFIGNVSNAPLNNVRAILNQVDHLRIQTHATEGLLEQQGCTIAAGTQAKLLLLVEVVAPFDDSPVIRVIFQSQDGMNQEHSLRLPIVATCFTTPLTFQMEVFKNQWHVLEEYESRNILKGVPVNEAYMQHLADIVKSLHFERCLACDDTPWSVTGACLFPTAAKDLNGNSVNVECLVRIEADHRHRALRYVYKHNLSVAICMNFYLPSSLILLPYVSE